MKLNFVILLCMIGCTVKYNKIVHKMKNQATWVIDLQTGFEGDSVTLIIEKYTLLNNHVVNSDYNSDYAKISFKYHAQDSALISSINGFEKNDKMKLLRHRDSLNIHFLVRSPSTPYVYDTIIPVGLKNKKYIGVMKNPGRVEKIHIYQQNTPYIYL